MKIFTLTLLTLFSLQSNAQQSYAYFAGGCFWCMEPPFEKLSGVVSVESGYMGGKKINPTYKDVSSGDSGHIEIVRVTYDPAKVSYQDLLVVFWMNIDPTDKDGQFVDRGEQYSQGVFYTNNKERLLFVKSRDNLSKLNIFSKPIVSFLRKATKFYVAEDYHQDYYKKNPIRYKLYRYNSGRDKFLNQYWKSKKLDKETLFNTNMLALNFENYKRPSQSHLKKKLTRLQFNVTQNDATEPPFKNKFWDHKQDGIYVDIVSGEPLFSSRDKYDSKTGWPSFTKPLMPNYIVEKKDNKLFYTRVEVRSKNGDSHLGHVFKDGPKPTGLRYCINSAALRFIPANKLKGSIYERFLDQFPNSK